MNKFATPLSHNPASFSPGTKGDVVRRWADYSQMPNQWNASAASASFTPEQATALREMARYRGPNYISANMQTASGLRNGINNVRSALTANPSLANIPSAPNGIGLNQALKRRSTNRSPIKGAAMNKIALANKLYALIGGLGALSSTGYFLTYLKDRAERKAWENKLERQMAQQYGRPMDAYIPEASPVILDALPKAAMVLDFMEECLENMQ